MTYIVPVVILFDGEKWTKTKLQENISRDLEKLKLSANRTSFKFIKSIEVKKVAGDTSLMNLIIDTTNKQAAIATTSLFLSDWKYFSWKQYTGGYKIYDYKIASLNEVILKMSGKMIATKKTTGMPRIYKPLATPVPEKPDEWKILFDKYQVTVWNDLSDDFRGTHFVYILNLKSGVHYESIRMSKAEAVVLFNKINNPNDFKGKAIFARLPNTLAPKQWKADVEAFLKKKGVTKGTKLTPKTRKVKKIRHRYKIDVKVTDRNEYSNNGIDSLNTSLNNITLGLTRPGKMRIKALMGTLARVHAYKTLPFKTKHERSWKISLSETSEEQATISTRILLDNIFKIYNGDLGWEQLILYKILSIEKTR